MYTFVLYLDNIDDFRLILKTIWILKTIYKLTWFFGFHILKVIFKSNSLAINKKDCIYIKCSIMNEEIIFHVHGYWKWFTQINDSIPLLVKDGFCLPDQHGDPWCLWRLKLASGSAGLCFVVFLKVIYTNYRMYVQCI